MDATDYDVRLLLEKKHYVGKYFNTDDWSDVVTLLLVFFGVKPSCILDIDEKYCKQLVEILNKSNDVLRCERFCFYEPKEKNKNLIIFNKNIIDMGEYFEKNKINKVVLDNQIYYYCDEHKIEGLNSIAKILGYFTQDLDKDTNFGILYVYSSGGLELFCEYIKINEEKNTRDFYDCKILEYNKIFQNFGVSFWYTIDKMERKPYYVVHSKRNKICEFE